MIDPGNEANNNPTFKPHSPSRQDIMNWIRRKYVFLQESKLMMQRSFKVCGKTTRNSGMIRNDDFLERIMANIEVDSDRTDDDEMFKDFLQN